VGWGRASSFGFSALAFSVGKNQMCLTVRWLFFSLQVTFMCKERCGFVCEDFPKENQKLAKVQRPNG